MSIKDEPKQQQKGLYGNCPCGCGTLVNSNKSIVGYPDTDVAIWCATPMCAHRVREKLRATGQK